MTACRQSRKLRTKRKSHPECSRNVNAEYLYGELTNGDDTVTETCIRNGVIRTKSLLQVVGKKFIPGLPLHRQIVRLLTIYEMYIYNGDEKGGHEYLVTATDLISDNYGSVESARTQGVPAGAIVKPNRKRL